MTKRILLIYDFLNEIGGIERLMCIHARYLINAGYKVKLLFSDINPESANNEIYSGLELEEYGSKKLSGPIKLISGIIGANNLKKIIQPEDILISYSFPVNVTIRNFNNIKIDYINHFPNFLYLPLNERWGWASDAKRKMALFYSLVLGWPTKYYDKKYVANNSLIFTNSNYTKNKIDPIYNINSVVSYPPVADNFKTTYNFDVIKKFNLPEKFILSGGRIENYKRYDLLIEAYSKIKNKDVPLVITGKWNEEEKIKLDKRINELGIKEKVNFIGFVTTEELINLYSHAILYAMSTPQSDYGYVTAEAICCGCPLVVWADGGGSHEQTLEGVNGYTAKPYDTQSFADAIDKCIGESFSSKNYHSILKSAEPFSAKYQEKLFIDNINSLLLNSNK